MDFLAKIKLRSFHAQVALLLVFAAGFCKNPDSRQPQSVFAGQSGFSVSGLSSGEKVSLISVSGDTMEMGADGKPRLAGTNEGVEVFGVPEVLKSPPGKICQVVLNDPDASTDQSLWKVECKAEVFFGIGGSVSGLSGTTIEVRLNDFKPVQISSDGTFEFGQALVGGSEFKIDIVRQPRNSNVLCSVSPRQGKIRHNIRNLKILCASGVFTVNGVVKGQKSLLTLLNSNGEELTVQAGQGQEKDFHFNDFIALGGDYSVSVKKQPKGQGCYVENARGVNVRHTVDNIRVVCSDLTGIEASIQFSGIKQKTEFNGKKIHLWFYTDPRQIVFPVFKKTVIFNAEKRSYWLQVAKGTYLVRAFLDVNNNDLPDIGVDYQSVPVWQWETKQDKIPLTLDTTEHDSRYQSFNAYLFSGSVWYQPGGGKCGGVYTRMEATQFVGNKNHVSPVYVMLPDYRIIELLNDGGCGNAFNNNSSSYDRQSGDNEVSAGIDASFGIRTGDYIFYYENYLTGKIGVFKDEITTNVPLTSNIHLTFPEGSQAVKTQWPVFSWNPVAGAGGYEILVESTDHMLNNFTDPSRLVETNSYRAPFALVDGKAYRVNIQAFDKDAASTEEDFDRVSQGPDNFFITDFSGNKHVIISGNLLNDSDKSGEYIIYGDSNTEKESWESSVFLPQDSKTYSLALLNSFENSGAVISAINVDTSGYILSEINRSYARLTASLSMKQNITMDLVWNKPLLLDSPAEGAIGIGDYPYFSWEDYSNFAPQDWSYVLWLTPYNSSERPILIGLKNNSFDFSRLYSEKFLNISAVYQCNIQSIKKKPDKEFSPASCLKNAASNESTLTDELKKIPQWTWKVSVVPCRLNTVENFSGDQTNNEGYMTCLGQVFSGEKKFFTESISRAFIK